MCCLAVGNALELEIMLAWVRYQVGWTKLFSFVERFPSDSLIQVHVSS